MDAIEKFIAEVGKNRNLPDIQKWAGDFSTLARPYEGGTGGSLPPWR